MVFTGPSMAPRACHDIDADQASLSGLYSTDSQVLRTSAPPGPEIASAAGLSEARRIAFWHDPRRRHLRRQASTAGSAPAFALAPASRPIDVGSTCPAV